MLEAKNKLEANSKDRRLKAKNNCLR